MQATVRKNPKMLKNVQMINTPAIHLQGEPTWQAKPTFQGGNAQGIRLGPTCQP